MDRLPEPEQVLHQEPGSVRRRTQQVRVERRESAAGEHHDVPNPKEPKVRTGSVRPAAARAAFIAGPPAHGHTHRRVRPAGPASVREELEKFWF